MFIECVREVDVGLADVEKSIQEIRSSMGDWADVAYRDGEKVRAKVGPQHGPAKQVDLEIGMAEIHAHGLVYPVNWTASGASLLFPELTADLILNNSGTDRTKISLRGTYKPPLGVVGRLADRALLGHVAEATVGDWMDRLVAGINSAVERQG